MSRILSLLAASALLLPALAAASDDHAASPYDRDLEAVRALHPHATEAEAREVAGLLSAHDIDLRDLRAAPVPPAENIHKGEVWTICQDVGWFFGGTNPCSVSSVTPTGLPCGSIPVHWALYVWAPATLSWTVTGGTPGYSPLTYLWTEAHLGVGPTVLHSGGSFFGSGCIFEYRFGPGDELVLAYGVGVWQPEA